MNQSKFKILLLLVLSAALFVAQPGFGQAAGKLGGKVVDKETGEPMPGVNVVLEGTMHGAATDLEGNFRIERITAGTYNVVATFIGYSTVKIQDVKIDIEGVQVVNFGMVMEVLQGEEVVVTASAIKTTEAALLKERQKAAAVSDAVSAEAISRSASSTAADAMEKVTGASVVDGKYLLIRGLGDRYSNTLLNGAVLPSANPDRNSVSFDLFPSHFLESIVTIKTFTPDRPGNFTGGSINIRTATFPEKFKMSFSTSSSFNSQTYHNNNFLSYQGGKTDWLGVDDGTREMPDPLSNPNTKIPDIGSAFTNREQAIELDRLSKAFNPVMVPSAARAPLNQGYSFSIGNQTSLFGKPLGYFASLSYSRNYVTYTNGLSAQYQLTGKVSQVNELTNLMLLSDAKGADEVLWGSLVNLSFKPTPNHSIHANYSYNRSGESTARYQVGPLPRDLAQGTFYETRVLQFVNRDMRSGQLSGDHYLKSIVDSRLDWTLAYANSSQDEPDLRFFSNDFTPVNRAGMPDTLYSIAASNYSRPVRYFRKLDEDIRDANVNLTIPFKQWSGRQASLKIGGMYGLKSRTFRERRFEYFQSSVRYNGDPGTFFAPENVGIIDSTGKFYKFGNYIVDASQLANNYDGDQDISAAFAMVDIPVSRTIRLITGARYETTDIRITSQDPGKEKGLLSTRDVLPSVNLITGLTNTMNIRAAYGRTLARPTFRELAPFASFDFIGDFIFIGNANLKRTLIDNYDVRWEWFMQPGEILAVSAFYKNFTNPIERAIVSNNNQGQYQNVDNARVFGLEFEFRKNLDVIHQKLANFQLGGNLSVIESQVDIPEKELLPILQLDPDASTQRPLQGQSPFVLNLDFGYANPDLGTSFSVYYNIFGERLSEVSLGGTPNVYEQPRNMLDVSVSQRLYGNLSLQLSGKNLLDSSVRKAHTFKGQDFVVLEHKLGRFYKIGLSYDIN